MALGRNIYSFVKRSFDIGSSLVALIVLSPVWLICAIGIKLSSKGPVFYTTERIGKGKKPFTLYKFRSMHVYQPDAEGKKSEGGYIANAKRIFPFGGFLRMSKLDELPQLLNILKGDMSVIGPRPVPITSVNRNYVGKYECILDVRPGLACLDSLFDYAHGELFVSDNEEYKAKVVPMRNELAKIYVEKQSIGIDFHCIFRTLQLMFQIAVLKRKKFPYTRYEALAEQTVYGATEKK